jgi:hypothetical protein
MIVFAIEKKFMTATNCRNERGEIIISNHNFPEPVLKIYLKSALTKYYEL